MGISSIAFGFIAFRGIFGADIDGWVLEFHFPDVRDDNNSIDTQNKEAKWWSKGNVLGGLKKKTKIKKVRYPYIQNSSSSEKKGDWHWDRY